MRMRGRLRLSLGERSTFNSSCVCVEGEKRDLLVELKREREREISTKDTDRKKKENRLAKREQRWLVYCRFRNSMERNYQEMTEFGVLEPHPPDPPQPPEEDWEISLFRACAAKFLKIFGPECLYISMMPPLR